MIKKIILIILSIIVVLIGVYVFLVCTKSQTDVYPDREEGRLCDMPLSGSPLMVEILPGLRFRIDSGSDMSVITERDLAKLDSLGYKAEKITAVTLGRNSNGDVSFSTTRYKVDLPTYRYNFTKDSLGNLSAEIDPSSLNVIHNVEFMPAPTDLSVLGVDFMEVFNVEYRHGDQAISLYLDTLDNYESSIPIKYSRDPVDAIWLSKRYYLESTVHDRTYDFFIDTGIRKANMKLPTSEMVYSRSELENDTIESFRGKYPAKMDKASWVAIGDRVGRRKVYYYDNDEEKFAINPFLFFKQDILINYSDRMIKLRPFCDLSAKE